VLRRLVDGDIPEHLSHPSSEYLNTGHLSKYQHSQPTIMQLLTLAALLPFVLAVPVAPVLKPRAAQLIPENYIVKLKDGASESSLQDAIRHVKAGNAKHVYRSGRFKGFAAKLSPQVLDAVRQLPEVCLHPILSALHGP
jgi:hypothetical protein